MSDVKWAAGLWGAEDHGVGELVVFSEATQRAVCILDDSDQTYAWPDGYSTSSEAKANAHLIAAAPDLAEAARRLLEWAESVEGHEVSRGITKTPDSVFTYARAALAKARGETGGQS